MSYTPPANNAVNFTLKTYTPPANNAVNFKFLTIAYHGVLKRWTGTAWVKARLRVFNGSTWVDRPLKYWDGTSWKLIDTTGV